MAELTPGQQRTQERFEGLIAAAAPFLDLLLGIGDRISRVVEPEDHEYYPVRSGAEASLLAEVATRPEAKRDGDA